MISHATLENLRGMRCSAMATAFQQQLDAPKTYGQLGFEERFSLIVDAEWNRRQANKLNKLIRDSAFSESRISLFSLSAIPKKRKVALPLKPLSTSQIGSWTKRRSCVLPPANISMMDTISSSAEPVAAERLMLPALLGMQPAASSGKSVISAFRNSWKS